MKLRYSGLTDQVLLEQFSWGSITAFREIYLRYWPLLLQMAFKMTRDQQQAEDIVQDVFESLLQKQKSGLLSIEKSLSSFLYQCARNRIIDNIRKSKLSHQYLSSLIEDIGRNNADERLRFKELQASIEKEVNKLPPKMREVFELSRSSYLSYQEIADQRQTSIETVRKQLHLSLKVLKGILGYGV